MAQHATRPSALYPTKSRHKLIEGYAGTFISIHALHYAAAIRLNRHIRVHALPTEKICRNLEQAFRMSHEFLGIMHSIAMVNRQQRLPATAASEFLFSTPFPGYALMLSVDVLTSSGHISAPPTD